MFLGLVGLRGGGPELLTGQYLSIVSSGSGLLGLLVTLAQTKRYLCFSKQIRQQSFKDE